MIVMVAAGVGFIITAIESKPIQPLAVVVIKYLPVAAVVILFIVLLSFVLAKPFAPSQLKLPPKYVAFKFKILPLHTGLLVVAFAVGIAYTFIGKLSITALHENLVAINL